MKMQSKVNTFLAMACLGVFAGLSPAIVQAQDAGGEHMDTGAKKMMKSADTAFAMKAAQGGMAEVKLGKLAADKASNPDVKAFGQQMVDDHSKANDDLKSTADKEGMTLPSDVNAKQQAMYDRLSKLSGAAFDRAYVNDMVKDHEEDVKEFQREANSGKDAQIKDFASRTLPVIQGHLDKIKSIRAKTGGGSSM
ncbi:MAG: DUF4142 domain-containing protein [Acidobacteriaceae bacterium]|nr:DUF4142 domain-containing protein [Acidobacteriaceae bacterium]MBV9764881.1 DUF4142 domain-containing protein [Acidobacteriaceae bacterium]